MAWAGRSLRGRLVLAFVGVAILAAVLIGVITLSLIRLVPERGLEQQLADQAQAVGEVVAGRRPLVRLCALAASCAGGRPRSTCSTRPPPRPARHPARAPTAAAPSPPPPTPT